jgi:hypothetical protein
MNTHRLLIFLQRKVGNEPNVKNKSKKRERDDTSHQGGTADATASQGPGVNPVLANILFRSGSNETPKPARPNSQPPNNGHSPPNRSQQEIARVAVGRGIRHSFSNPNARKPAQLPPRPLPSAQVGSSVPAQQPTSNAAPVVQASLSALKTNFQNSFGAAQGQTTGSTELSDGSQMTMDYVPGSMRHDDSLVDLAMIPLVDEGNHEADFFSPGAGFSFIDFPWQDPNAPSSG